MAGSLRLMEFGKGSSWKLESCRVRRASEGSEGSEGSWGS